MPLGYNGYSLPSPGISPQPNFLSHWPMDYWAGRVISSPGIDQFVRTHGGQTDYVSSLAANQICIFVKKELENMAAKVAADNEYQAAELKAEQEHQRTSMKNGLDHARRTNGGTR
jgi:hypothetical protein